VITSFKRLIAALTIVLPAAALVTSPVMADTTVKPKVHHVVKHKTAMHKSLVHKTAMHKTHTPKKKVATQS
jgi:hypothetical protein